MDELKIALKVLLADVFIMYYKTHSMHWNIEGDNFPQYHAFLGTIYQDVFDSIDPIAENLRKLDAYAPVSIEELYKSKSIEEDTKVTGLNGMLQSLKYTNSKVISTLNKVYDLAEKQKEHGISNFIADRIDTHKKHEWMLRSSLKTIS